MAKDEIASRGEAANPAKTADKKLEKAGPERFDQSADLNAAASAVAGMGAATGFEQDEGGLSSPAPKQGADGAGSSVPATDALPEYDVTAAAASPVEATRSETNPQDPPAIDQAPVSAGPLADLSDAATGSADAVSEPISVVDATSAPPLPRETGTMNATAAPETRKVDVSDADDGSNEQPRPDVTFGDYETFLAPENSEGGFVVASFDGTDHIGTPLTYTLTDANGAPITDANFMVVGSEIHVRPDAELDFETLESHEIFVVASDGVQTTQPESLTIVISDVAEDLVLGDEGVAFADLGVTETSITGGSSNDTITGTAENDDFAGADGNDALATGAGDDLLDGGAGNDFLTAGTGQDTLVGGGGNDALDGSDGSDVAVYTGSWFDYTITESDGVYTIVDNRPGSPDGTDTVTDVETFSFADGDKAVADLLNVGPTDLEADNTTIAENSAAGTVVATLSTTDANAGDSHSYAITSDPSGFFEIVGDEVQVAPGAELDFETATSHDITIQTTDAHGETYSETVTITVSDTAEDIQLADGGTGFSDMGVVETSITGGSGNDTITAHEDGGNIDGGAGDDTLVGGNGADTIAGGYGYDNIEGGEGDDSLSGEWGKDTITAGDGDDTVDGGGWDDATEGGLGDDNLAGGTGHDTLNGGAGDDTVDGGIGVDVAEFSGSWSDYTITESDGVYTITDNRPGSPDGTDTVTEIETFRFADGDVALADLLNVGPTDLEADNTTIAENSAAGTVVATLSTTDANAGDSHSYAITSDPSGFFEIVGDEVQVAPGAELDFETATSHDITIQTTDAHGETYSETVTITVSDTAENIQLADGGVSFSDMGVVETSITGGSGNDTITAHEDGGNIDGGAGDDSLLGGAGDDTMSGDGGTDTIIGGGGDDQITMGWGDDLGEGGAGNDTIYGQSGDDTVIGGDGDDVLTGDAGNDLVEGGEGDDRLYGSGENDTLIGGDGNDSLTGGWDQNLLDGGAGADTINGGTDEDTLIGGAGDDVLRGNDGSDTAVFSGNWSDYTITESNGVYTIVDNRPGSPDGTDTVTDVETFRFADGDVAEADLLNVGPSITAADGSVTENDQGAVVGAVSASDPNAGDTVTIAVDDARFEVVDGQLKLKHGESLDYEEDGASVSVTVTATDVNGATDTQVVNVSVGDVAEDLVLADGGVTLSDTGVQETSISGGDGNDTIEAHSDGGSLDGADGDDSLRGSQNADSLVGGEGNDTLDARGGDDTVIAGAGDDLFDDVGAENGNDLIDMGEGNDRAWAGDGDDTLYGGSGNDYLSAESGDDSVDGGTGDDTVFGGDGADTVLGGDGNDTIYGNAGEDSLEGGAGADKAYGGEGEDTITGGDGDDFLRGGDEKDILSGGADNDTLLGDGGDDHVDGGGGDDRLSGGDGNDTVFGGDGDDTFHDAGVVTGNDYIDMGAGDDFANASEGNDTILGGSGADTLSGHEGDDQLEGGSDDDTIYGGDGTDIAVFSGNWSDYTITNSGEWYTITDNRPGSPDGTDRVTDVETFRFADGDVAEADLLNVGPTDLEADNTTVAENSAAGTVVATLSTTDANAGDSHSYAITSDPSGFFEIVGDEVQVAPGAELDFETATSHDITIQTTDAHGETYSETVTITVSDTAEDIQLADGGTGFSDMGVVEMSITGGSGNDTITAHEDGGNIDGGAGDDSLLGGAGDDTMSGDSGEINEVTLSIGGSDRNGVPPEFEVYADGVLVYSGSVTWAQDGASAFDPSLPGAFQDVVVALPGGAPDQIQVRYTNDYVADDETAPGEDRNLLLDSITVGETTYEAETDAALSGGGVSGNNVNLWGGGNTATFDTTDATTAGGADTIFGGAGDDSLSGGSDGDTFVVQDGFGNDTIEGGEGGDDADVIDLSGLTGPVTVTYTGDEAGTITDGADTITFSEIEQLILSDEADVVDATSDSAGVDLDAGAGNDFIETGAGNDSILGGAGNDSIFYGDGDNTVYGGAGNDLIDEEAGNPGFIGNNSVFGGEGNDIVFSGWGDDTIDGGEGNDLLNSQMGDDLVQGGTGNDTIYGEGGNDTLEGGDDADRFVIQNGFGNDVIVGGEGGTDDDVIDLSNLNGPVTVTYTGNEEGTITDGTDTITFSEIERFTLTDHDDSVDGSVVWDGVGGDNPGIDVEAGGGNDTIIGGNGGDTIDGGTGNDSIYGDYGDDSLIGGDGDDTIHGGTAVGNDTILGGDGNDSIDGGSQADTLHGDAGDDTILGGEGTDSIEGGSGDDVIDGGDNTDTIRGGDGNDFITDTGGSLSDDTIYGEAGNDTIAGGQREDYLDGGDDADTFVIDDSFGNDTIVGGEGGDDQDVIDLSNLTGSVTVTYTGDDAGTITDGTDTITFSEVENLILTDQADSVDMNEHLAVHSGGIDTGAGNDTVTDISTGTVYGGAGDDDLEVDHATTQASIDGGSGTDTIRFDSDDAEGVDVVLTGTDAGTYDWSSAGEGSFSGIEHYDLTNMNDSFDGSLATGSITVEGGRGNDTISGGAGNDVLDGGRNNDVIDGGAGEDTLLAGYGSDQFIGGADFDYLDIAGSEVAGFGFTIDLDAGTDTYGNSYDGIEGLIGGSGNDTFTGDDRDNDLRGGDGSDTFKILDGFGNDTVSGGNGGSNSDTLDLSGLSAAATVTFTGPGAGTITQGAHTITFSEIERLILTDQTEVVDASDLNTGIEIISGDGFDTITGGSGNDTISMGYSNSGNVLGGTSNVAYGGAGDDVLSGSNGNQALYGGDGNDTITGGDDSSSADHDTLDGGAGNDSITSGLSVAPVNADWQEHGDSLSGGAGNDTLEGGSTEDTLSGGTGDDLMSGGLASDTFIVEDGFGNDTIAGGDGAAFGDDIDTIDLSALSSAVTVTFTGPGTGTITDGSNSIEFSEIERLILTEQADVVDASADTSGIEIVAAGENDTVTGGSGNDSIDGGAGDDVIAGGGGDDTIEGGAGDDTISGGGANSDAPILLMNFEDGASATAADATGNGFDGVYRNGATAGGSGWDGSGTALQLDGVDDYVEIADNSAFDLNEGTIAIRFNANDIGESGNDALFSRDSSYFDGGGHVGAWVRGDGSIQLRIQSDSDSYYVTTDPGLVSDGQWHHFAVTFGADGVSLYVDGVEAATNSYTGGIAGNNEPWTLGANQMYSGDEVANNLQEYFNGQIDEFALFDNALDAGQIADIATSGVSMGGTGYGDDDLLTGGEGSDTFLMSNGFGNDAITGGETGTDQDVIDLGAVTGPVTVTYTGDEAGTITDGTDTISFSEVEELVLTENADVVNAAADSAGIYVDAGLGDDSIAGGAGADSLLGGDGTDSISGGAGNDTMEGGLGADTMLGGDGNDVIRDSWEHVGDYIDAGAGDDTIEGGGEDGNDTIFGGSGNDSINCGNQADSVDGGSGSDTIQSDWGANTISGGEGNDSIWGGGHGDTITGGDGNDTILGDGRWMGTYGGNDSLDGGVGDDSLSGGLGNDTLFGGDGSDSFQVGAFEGNDIVSGGTGGGWTDSIQLEGMGSNISITGDTVDGDGWTMVLDSGSTIDSQDGNQLFFSDDAAGVITFDAGGEVDFAGIESVSW